MGIQQEQQPQQPVPQQFQQVPTPPTKKGFFNKKLGPVPMWAIIIVLIIVVAIGVSASKGGGSSSTTTTQNNSSSTTTTQSRGTTQANTIGKPVQAGDTWVVTLNSIKSSKGDDINTPKSGDIYLVVDVTLKNVSSDNQSASSLLMFNLKDNTGQKYDQNIAFGNSPDGPVSAGSTIRGQIAYEVPASMHSFTLQFTPGLGSDNLTEWNITI